MVSTTSDLLDAVAFAALPDEGRLDLIRGELLRMPPAGGEHGEIGSEVNRQIANYVVEHGLGRTYGSETGFLLGRDPDTVLAPDVAFVRADRLPPREERRGFMELAPDLVVEIVSPSDRAGDVNAKVMEYLEAGVQLVWVLEPKRQTVTVYTPDLHGQILRSDDDLTGGEVLPGFAVAVKDLFHLA